MKNLIVLIFLVACLGLNCQSNNPEPAANPPQMMASQDTLPFENVSAENLPLVAVSGQSMDAEAIDIDQDGDLDIIVANEFGGNILLLNDGEGKFSNASQSRLPQKSFDSEDIALGDFDKDGDIDIIFVSEDNQVNEYYLNSTGVFLDAGDRLPVTGTTNAIISLDFNQDEALDLMLGNAGQNVILINDGNGNFQNDTQNRLPSIQRTTQDLEAGDIDQDGDLDILVGNEDGNYYLINNGMGVFTRNEDTQLPTNPTLEETREADMGDVDGDGDLDIFFANVAFAPGKVSQNRLLLNDGQGNFTDQTSENLPSQILNTLDGDFEDIDQDGDLDLLIANSFGGNFRLYVNDGQGKFEDKTNAFFPNILVDAIDVELADFNGDGISDLYICNFQGADVLLIGKKV